MDLAHWDRFSGFISRGRSLFLTAGLFINNSASRIDMGNASCVVEMALKNIISELKIHPSMTMDLIKMAAKLLGLFFYALKHNS